MFLFRGNPYAITNQRDKSADNNNSKTELVPTMVMSTV